MKPSDYIYDAEDEQYFEELDRIEPSPEKKLVPIFAGELDIFCPIQHSQGAVTIDDDD